MKTRTEFIANGDRYRFDFRICSPGHGFAQIDTGQDAWYFGTWANPTKLIIVNYAEGDLTTWEAETMQEFVDQIRNVKKWNDENGHSFAIDPMERDEIREGFDAMGLGDLLHKATAQASAGGTE